MVIPAFAMGLVAAMMTGVAVVMAYVVAVFGPASQRLPGGNRATFAAVRQFCELIFSAAARPGCSRF